MPAQPDAPDRTIAPRDGAAPVVAADEVRRRYGDGESAVEALRGVSLSIPAGQFAAIMGPSGSGKSTLMHVLAGLDRATAGAIRLDDRDVTAMSDQELTILRRERIGFVFQFFNLLPMLSAEENVVLPLTLAGSRPDAEWIDEVLDRVGLADRRSHRPSELSGGQQQRVAIARALATRPAVLFADEPTGNLDSSSGQEILALVREAVDAYGLTTLMVTHDPVAAAAADRVLVLADGRLVRDLGRSTETEVLTALGELTDAHPPRAGSREVTAVPAVDGGPEGASEPEPEEPSGPQQEEASEPEPEPEEPHQREIDARANGAGRGAPGLERAWRPAVLAYCSRVCGDPEAGAATDAVFASFGEWSEREAPGRAAAHDDALVRITRAEAAKRALVSVEAGEAAGTAQAKVRSWLGRDELTAACRAMPTMLAARANGVLSSDDVDRMTSHLTRCLVCKASEQRFDDAERALAVRRRATTRDDHRTIASPAPPAPAPAPPADASPPPDRRPSHEPSPTRVLPPRGGAVRTGAAEGRRAPRRTALIVIAAVLVPTALVVGLIALALGASTDEPGEAPAAEAPGQASEDSGAPAGAEAAPPPPPTSVSVLSGTNVDGLAARTAKRLDGRNFEIDTVGNARSPVLESVVLYDRGAARDARAIGKRLKIATVQPMGRDDRKLAGDAQVLVLAGPDLAPDRAVGAPSAGAPAEEAPTGAEQAPAGEAPPSDGGAPEAAPSGTP